MNLDNIYIRSEEWFHEKVENWNYSKSKNSFLLSETAIPLHRQTTEPPR